MAKKAGRAKDIFETLRSLPIGKKAAVLSATCLGLGLVPKAPGTFGTMAAIPFAFALSEISLNYRILLLLGIIALAIWVSDLHATIVNRSDPQEVVIDEVAGFLLATCFVTFTWFNVIAGFLLFRFFDIIKPFPVNALEKLKGGLGIVADDLTAGLYAMAALFLLDAGLYRFMKGF